MHFTIRYSVALSLISTLALTLPGGMPASAQNVDADRAQLVEGVTAIGRSGSPGPLCLYGEKAFAVIVASSGTAQQPLVAASRMGKGRVVAFGHTGYISDVNTLAKDDTLRLLANAVRWAGDQQGRKLDAGSFRVAVYRNQKVADLLKTQGVNAASINALEPPMQYHVLIADPCSIRSDEQLSLLWKYINAGGGYVGSGLGWGWKQLNPGRDLVTDHVGNRLLADAGIAWADGTVNTTADDGFSAEIAPSAMTNAHTALTALLRQHSNSMQLDPEQQATGVKSVETAARSLPQDESPFMQRLQRVIAASSVDMVPTARNRVSEKQPLARLAITLQTLDMKRNADKRQPQHPAAVDFPGPVSDSAERVTKTLNIDTQVPAWHSTGLYAAPGELIEVQVPESVVELKRPVKVRIGAHKDTLWHKDSWQRCPEITIDMPIRGATTSVSNPFGGPVYIEVPKDCPVPAFDAVISGAVPAPYYVLGKTDLSEWCETIRNYPAPWAELATDKVILTVPSEVVRELDDPKTVMEFWDDVMDATAILSCRPVVRERPERYVPDRQISAGYMHSGYPIMTGMDVRGKYVDIDHLRSGNWGFFHEVGHNHQSGLWTFAGTGEVTVNLFTLYIYDTVCGIPVIEARSMLSRDGRMKKVTPYIEAGSDFSKWQSDPFLALIMYVQLQEAFGWDTFIQVFEEYRDLSRTEQPRSDQDKRDQWMVRFSRATGKNLGPFFELWGVPTSDSARDSIKDLPVWMPEELQ